jgi:hypothetical protein
MDFAHLIYHMDNKIISKLRMKKLELANLLEMVNFK